MDTGELVIHAMRAMRSHPQASDDAVAAMLTAAGVDESTATRLIQLVPIACCHEWFRDSGIKFSPFYILIDHAGRRTPERRFTDEPIYAEAARVAAGSRDELLRDVLGCIAKRTAEYSVIRKFEAQGSAPSNIAIASPALLRQHLSDVSPRTVATPWWRRLF